MELHSAQNPNEIFRQWLEDARKTEPADAEAMTLATVAADGTPAARMVLLKNMDDRGFVFYTNTLSPKGQQLGKNPKAALCFYWKSSQRQVRVEGAVEGVAEQEADDYFVTRPIVSRLGAWASQQSQPLESRAILEGRIKELEHVYADKPVPRPPHWSGYRLWPAKIEFWQAGDFRLHDRFLFTRSGESWAMTRLYP